MVIDMERNEDLTRVFDRTWKANHNNDVKDIVFIFATNLNKKYISSKIKNRRKSYGKYVVKQIF